MVDKSYCKKKFKYNSTTEWMKEALVARIYNKDKILIAKPDINNIQIENIEVKNMMRTYYSIQQLIINIKILL